MGSHSKVFAPSAAHRLIACPGSKRLEKQVPPQKDTSFSREGTAAHALGENCLKRKCDADEFLGQVVYESEGRTYTADQEMIEAVQVYLDAVREEYADTSGKSLHVEKRFDLSWLHPGIFGSNDCCVHDVHKKTLRVFDYKHGKGVVVEPDWNPQLLMYALGAIKEVHRSHVDTASIDDIIQTVTLTIVQPRAYHDDGFIRNWTISIKDLLFWAINVLKPAILQTQIDSAPLHVGTHCRFCPALAVCPEQMRSAMELAKTNFDNPVLPDPGALTPEEIVKVMNVASIFSVWANEVKAYAQGQMESGRKLPGYKLVAKRANRKWTDEEGTGQVLNDLIGDFAFEKKVLSVAKAEKALKKAGLSPEACLQGLWFKNDNGVTLAADSDRRKEVSSPSAIGFIEDMDFLK